MKWPQKVPYVRIIFLRVRPRGCREPGCRVNFSASGRRSAEKPASLPPKCMQSMKGGGRRKSWMGTRLRRRLVFDGNAKHTINALALPLPFFRRLLRPLSPPLSSSFLSFPDFLPPPYVPLGYLSVSLLKKVFPSLSFFLEWNEKRGGRN